MAVKTSALLLLILPFIGASALAQTTAKPLPYNTIDCNDWTHNPDGSWQPHDNEKPFDLGTSKASTITGSAIYPHSDTVGGVDLWTVLDQKCGGKS